MATLETPTAAATSATSVNFQRYYEEAGPDYAAWSPHFNMHFGFFRWGMSLLRREPMLEQMNQEILHRLHVTGPSVRVLDMGCGLGATLRSFARRLPESDLNGITLVPWQLEQGRQFNRACPEGRNITLTLGDYEHTTHPSATFNAVFAIESSCYAHAADKSAFLQEAHRLLRPGGRIVVADGFLGPGKLRGPQKSIYATSVSAGQSTPWAKWIGSPTSSTVSASATSSWNRCKLASRRQCSTFPGSHSNSS